MKKEESVSQLGVGLIDFVVLVVVYAEAVTTGLIS